jgi:hypothetical protein
MQIMGLKNERDFPHLVELGLCGECLTHAPGNPKLRTPATSSDAPAVKREAEEDSTKRDGDNGWQQPDHDLRP